MARINNTELTNELVQGGKIQTSLDITPNQLADKVVPVMEVNPKMLKYANVVVRVASSATGTSTIYTTPSDKDFYLTSISINITKNAACDMVTAYINGTPLGAAATRIIDLNFQTTTANDCINIQKDYTYPIRMEKSSTIQFLKTFTAGAASFSVTICGYTIDNPNT